MVFLAKYICLNYQARSSSFPGRCGRLLILSQTCSIEERSGYLAAKGSILQAVRQFITTQVLCGLASSSEK
ncbi:hypothetical protein TNCV_3307841 [Trichonephila clavipes]|nr:hypothetical protein TNCV_3307841 [Trichonephila clavipes]